MEKINYFKKNILFQNSFYGKLAQRSNFQQTRFIQELSKYFDIMSDPTLEVMSFTELNENNIQIDYKKQEEYVQACSSSNPVLAAFVTSLGRLRLHSFLTQLGTACLYSDTGMSKKFVSLLYLETVGVNCCLLGDSMY